MTKLLIFLNDKNCDQGKVGFNLFTCLNIKRPVSFPVYLSANGIVKEHNSADIIIFPDADIINGKDIWENCYNCLKELCNENVSLLIVRHTNGWNYKETETSNDEDTKLKEYLCKQPDISASHVSGDFYCNELKAIAEAIQRNNELSYQQALQTAKEKFGNPLLEAKLKLLNALLVPPSNLSEFENDNGLWKKLIDLIGDDNEKNALNEAWNTFKEGFNEKNLDSQYIQILSTFRDRLLKEYKCT